MTTVTRPAPATSKQIDYLQSLRRRIGRDRWNRIKIRLGIIAAGTYGLSQAEAARLIEAILDEVNPWQR